MNYVSIEELCEILNGYAFKSDNYVEEGVRIIRIANVQKGYIEDNTPVFCQYDNLELEKYMLMENDLLISLTGNVGRVALLTKEFLPAALNQRVACLRLKNKEVLKKYLFYCLSANGFEEKCIRSAKGVAQKNMSTEWLKKYKIPLYSSNEQIQIVRSLDFISRTINNRKKQLQKLDELIQARFVEMFGDPVLNEKGWRRKPLLDMGNCKNGMNFHYDDCGVEINCLGVGDFKDLSIIDNTEQLPTVSLKEMPSEEYLLKDDDVVFVRSNGNKTLVGRSVAVYPGEVATTFSGFCIRYRKYDEEIRIPYLLRVLKTDSIRRKMTGRGANIQNLNQQILSNLLIPVPPIELQNQFADFVNQVNKSKLVIKNLLQIYKHQIQM